MTKKLLHVPVTGSTICHKLFDYPTGIQAVYSIGGGGACVCRVEWDWLFLLLPFCFSVGLTLQIIGSQGYINASNQLLSGQPIFPFKSARAKELAYCFCNTRAIIGKV